ncbi:MAG: hypothetical protein QXD57_07440 [Ignisphaera sp.]
MWITRYFRTWVITLVLFTLTLATLRLMVVFDIVSHDMLSAGIREAMQPLIVLSVSLLVFPFISVSAVESVVLRAQSLGLKVSKSLLKDYVDGCFTVFFLSAVELLLLVLYAFTRYGAIVFVALAVLASLVFNTVNLMLGLWQITRLMMVSEVSKM